MKLFTFIIIFLISFFKANATHIAGADLTYKCLGGNTYLITLSFYRECGIVEAPQYPKILFKSSCTDTFTIPLYKIDSTGNEVTPGCPQQLTSCNGGFLYGLQQYVYQSQVVLPPCSDWQMSYSLCCRNFSNTIENWASTSMFILATLNNKDFPCSGSPVFSNIPVTIICEGQKFCFNHGAIDPDGDSLSYSLVNPYDNGPGNFAEYIIYKPGYSPQQPINSEYPVTIDHHSGDICMHPSQLIISPLAVLVEKFRNGILVGTVLRDMQVNVTYCDNHLPTLSGIDIPNSYYDSINKVFFDTVCIGNKISFQINAFDKDSDNITLSWNKAVKNASFTIHNNFSPKPYALFEWTPDKEDLRNSAHCFTVTVADSACPYIGTQTFSYCVYVKGFYVELGQDTSLCYGQSYLLRADADSSAKKFNWYINNVHLNNLPPDSHEFLFNSADYSIGKYLIEVKVEDNSTNFICPGYDKLNLTVYRKPQLNLPSEIKLCNGRDTVINAGYLASRFLWNTGDTTNSIIVNSAGTYIVEADGGFGTDCKISDTTVIKMIPMPPPVNLGNDTCINNLSQEFMLSAGNLNQSFFYLWSDSNTTNSIIVNKSDVYAVTVSSDLLTNCFTSDSVKVIFVENNFLGSDITHCIKETLLLNSPINFLNTDFFWYPSGSTENNLLLNNLSLGENMIVFYSKIGCSDTLKIFTKTCDLKIPDIILVNSPKNNSFEIQNISDYPNTSLIIFNRWGNVVFESDNYNPTSFWTPENTPDGVYFYILNVSGKEVIKGYISILN